MKNLYVQGMLVLFQAIFWYMCCAFGSVDRHRGYSISSPWLRAKNGQKGLNPSPFRQVHHSNHNATRTFVLQLKRNSVNSIREIAWLEWCLKTTLHGGKCGWKCTLIVIIFINWIQKAIKSIILKCNLKSKHN